MADEVRTIEFLPCGYQARCQVKNCTAQATTITRAADAHGRPLNQFEICAPHVEQVAERERAKGREILKR